MAAVALAPVPVTSPLTASVVKVVPFDENTTLNVSELGVTLALELIVKVLEKAAKPTDNPTTATNKATIAITLELLSFSIYFTSFYKAYSKILLSLHMLSKKKL